MLNFFTDLPYLLSQIGGVERKNVLCVYRNPPVHPDSPETSALEFVGYDLVDVYGGNSALTNCGGYPDVFANSELSSVGLLPVHTRAFEVQSQLRLLHPEEPHADCHVWAVFRKFE